MPASAPMRATLSFYAPLPEARDGLVRRALAAGAVVAVHLALAALLVLAAVRPEVVQEVRALAVRMIEAPRPVPPQVEPPKPLPPQAQPLPRKILKPLPVLAAAKSDEAPARFAVAPQPEPVAAPPVLAPPAPPAPAPITAARFDADYLQNPKPVYPPMSRRLGEEGKVVLRVRVSRDGHPLTVEIRQSSGYARLDDAAKNAVERWRFVPARQGDEPVEASVLVPLNFTLNS